MARNQGLSKREAEQLEHQELAENNAKTITVNNGTKQMEVTNKAFNTLYVNRGFTEGKLKAEKATAETKTTGAGGNTTPTK